mgnify:CR=1 FL=1
MHVQHLLSALRASIVNQLEEAEVQMAMRQSMENYKPHMSPACKMSIGNLIEVKRENYLIFIIFLSLHSQ